MRSASAKSVLPFLEVVVFVWILNYVLCQDDYDPKRYSVTDKATQPDVIGFAVAAATEALRVLAIHSIESRMHNSMLTIFQFPRSAW